MSWAEERRANMAARAEQAREDRRLELDAELQQRREEAEQRRLDEAAAAERRRKEEQRVEQRRRQKQERKAAAKAGRKAARAARVGRAASWVKEHPADLFVSFVMCASVVPAVISQVEALRGAGVLLVLAILLAAMLEGSAWAMVFLGKRAEQVGEPTARFRIGGWLLAAVAGGINYWHWSAVMHADRQWVAWVFGLSSLLAFGLWDMRTHRSTATREERSTARKARRHARQRRKHHAGIAQAADRLLSATEPGELTESEAFAAAWRIHYGCEPGMTPDLFRTATAARAGLTSAFADAGERRSEMIRAGLLAGLHNPVPGALGKSLPKLGPSTALEALQAAPQGRTTQFPLEKGASPGEVASAAQEPPGNAADAVSEGRGNEADERAWERHLPRAREVAVDLVAEGKTISATSLAKRLKIRRKDAIKVRDAVIAERREQTRPLRLVIDESQSDQEAVSA